MSYEKEWVFPCQLDSPNYEDCDFVYSFVLDTIHIINIGGYDCVTMGHGFESPVLEESYFPTESVKHLLKDMNENKDVDQDYYMFESSILTHAYFGTQKVFDDLKEMKGWESGLIKIKGIKRDDEHDGLVNGLVET
jgi:hypothetical protein